MDLFYNSIIEIDGAAESKTVDKYMRELDLKDNKRSGGNQDDDDDGSVKTENYSYSYSYRTVIVADSITH